MPNGEKAALIIPAYNEAARIGAVIDAAQHASGQLALTDQVIVVDNNSTDNTAGLAAEAGAIVVGCTEQGKAPAMARGAEVARNIGAGLLTFLDADLVNITGDHVDQLILPVQAGEATMTIGYLGERRELIKRLVYKRWGMFAGPRCLPVEVWDQLSEHDLHGFRAEAALNSLFRNSGRGDEIERIELDGVSHVGKFDKYPLGLALKQYFKIEASALRGLLTSLSL
ncbi:MAG TPA: glycosyltransferase [Candidatus Saccharibacteria bacterium]|nr:glycosyltransferase [Candidatus Saccharibacteria bacterium]